MYSPGDKTPFVNIKKFPPGHYSEINTAEPLNINFKKYYQIPFNGQRLGITEKVAIEQVDSALTNAVKRQLLSDVPVGFFLSGGLDSSLIVAKAKEMLRQSLIGDASSLGARRADMISVVVSGLNGCRF